MKTEIIEFKDAEIYCPVEKGIVYVAIKPICTVLGIDSQPQIERLKRNRKFASVATIMTATGSDSKGYKMICLPLKFVFGWLASIDTSKVKKEVREQIEDYQMECYEVLYDHFWNNANRYQKRDTHILKIQDEVDSAKRKRTLLAKEIKEKEALIKEMLRTDPNQTDLFLDSDKETES
jgi:uncharacterized protein YktB (UPF0637 family)